MDERGLPDGTTERPSDVDRAPDAPRISAPRFLVEVIAWVAAPWALWHVSVLLAVAALIAIPTTFGMPGAKQHRPLVAVPGPVAIGIELVQPMVAVVAAEEAWPWWVAVVVVGVAVVACLAQRPRWSWMTRH